MTDIAPELFEKIQKAFQERFEGDSSIAELYSKAGKGVATYADAHQFAMKTGEILAGIFGENLSSGVLPDGKMYYNIAERIISPMLEGNYQLVTDVTSQVQKILNEKAGIGIRAVKPEMNSDRINGIVNGICQAEQHDDAAGVFLQSVVNYTLSVVDDSVRANADFQSKAGLKPKIIRRATGKCCEWCAKLVGTYDYEKVSNRGNDVFRRHRSCKCIVEYDPGEGKEFQNVHTRQWRDADERDKIESRKKAGVNRTGAETPAEREQRVKNENGLGLADRIANHPQMLQAYTPKGLKASLERDGYEVKPLGRGGLKGVPFEDGGGYRVNFGGDRLLQYHPAEGSRHEGEYYKISSGQGGVIRYDRNGNEKLDHRSG